MSCRKRLSGGREHEIYWQVVGDEIYGTTTASEASTFYIQCNEEQFCHIIHKTSDLQTPYFATIQRPFNTERPLMLVPYPEDEQDICFTLMSKTKKPVDVPQTEHEWKTRSPFFIKLPAGGIPIIGQLFKPMRFISVRKTIDKGKKKTKASNADAKAKHTSASSVTLDFKNGEERKQEIESCDSVTQDKESQYTPASGASATPDIPPKSKETKETGEMQNRESIVDNFKYTTGSSATLDTKDKYVITTQFYFTPVGDVQGSRVAITSGPPPPPSRIESDSASDRDELVRQQQEEDDIKQAFIELVGREYVFPLPVKAVEIPDTQ